MRADHIRAALTAVRNEIWLRETSDDRAHTGFYRERMRNLLATEARLTGLLRRFASPLRGDPPEPEQLELALT